MSRIFNQDVSVLGSLTVNPVNGAGGILTMSGSNVVTFRTPAEILSDINAAELGADVNFNSVQFLGGTGSQGLVSWNTDEWTLDVIQNGTVLQVGQETQYQVRNNSGVTINDGEAVMATGTIGASGRITVAKYLNDGSIKPDYFIGIATETILNDADGKVTNFGKIRGIQTNGVNYGEAWVDGDLLYLSPTTPGTFTKVQPPAPGYKAPVAIVVNSHATNGTLFVRVTGNEGLHELHDVQATNLVNKDVIRWVSANNRYENYSSSSWDLSVSTGIVSGGALSINGVDNTKFDVAAGSGYIVDITASPPTVTEVTWGAFTSQTLTNLATSFATDIAIDVNGNIVQQDSFTDIERRNLIFLGGLDHSNQTNILSTFSIQVPMSSPASSISELSRAIGDINISGNVYAPNGANLSLDKSGGVVFSYGRNTVNDKENPHKITVGAKIVESFGYVFNNGSGVGTFTTPVTSIDPDNYDDGTGVLASVPLNKWTIQRILFFPNDDKTFVQYGTAVYNKEEDALNAVPRADFPALSGIRTAMVRGYIIVKQGETDLTSTDTDFLTADKFGTVAGLDGGSSLAVWGNITGTLSNQIDLQSALDLKAIDSLVVHKAGTETITGRKIFNAGNTDSNLQSVKSATGNGIVSTLSGSGNVGIYLNNTGTGNNIVSDGSSTGFNYVGQRNGLNNFTVDTFGNIVTTGNITGAIPALGSPATTFLTHTAGLIQSRTATQLLSDIGAAASFTFGTDNQIPVMNAGGTDFEYQSSFRFNASLNGLQVGVDNTDVGRLYLYGNGAGEQQIGGAIFLYAAADSDSTNDLYSIYPWGENLKIADANEQPLLEYFYATDNWSTVKDFSANAFVAAESITVGPTPILIEDFSVSLGSFTTSGSQLWTRVTDRGVGDTFSAKAGAITHGQTSTLQLIRTFNAGDILEFDLWISSELSYDFLTVYVNAVQFGQWSGVENGFSKRQIVIDTTGSKTITWVYSKDGSASRGEDSAWIDNVRVIENTQALTLGGNITHNGEFTTSGEITSDGGVNAKGVVRGSNLYLNGANGGAQDGYTIHALMGNNWNFNGFMVWNDGDVGATKQFAIANGGGNEANWFPIFNSTNPNTTVPAMMFYGNHTGAGSSQSLMQFDTRISGASQTSDSVVLFGWTSGYGIGGANERMRLTGAGNLTVSGTYKATGLAAAATDTDKFLVADGTTFKYRTGAEVLSDIGGAASSSIQDWLRADIADTANGKITFAAGFDDTTTTGLGKVGNLGLSTIVATTDWANLPVGYSKGVSTASTGEPSGANAGYFTKIANRDVSGGWGGLWVDYTGTNAWFGRAIDNTVYATWDKIISEGNASTVLSQFLRSDVADSAAGLITFNAGATIGSNQRLKLHTNSELFGNGVNSYFDLFVGDFIIRDTSTTRFTFGRTTGYLTANRFVTSGGTSSQFVKGDGTLDSNGYSIQGTGSNIWASPPDGTAYYAKIATWTHTLAYSHFNGVFKLSHRYGISKFTVETSVGATAATFSGAAIVQDNTLSDSWTTAGSLRILYDTTSGTTTVCELWGYVPGWAGSIWGELEDVYLHSGVSSFTWSPDDSDTNPTMPSGVSGQFDSTGNMHIGGNLYAGANVYAGGSYFVFGASTGEGEYLLRSGNDVRIYAGGNPLLTVTGDSKRFGLNNTAPQCAFDIYYNSSVLGGTAGNSLMLKDFTTPGGAGGNEVSNRLYALRDATGTSWTTYRLHDSIDVDNVFNTPGTNTRTFWERDPNSGFHYFGDSANYALSIDGANNRVGINRIAPSYTLDVNGTGRFADVVRMYGTTPNKLRLISNDTVGDTYLSFYENDDSTLKGYIGYGASVSDEFILYQAENSSIDIYTNSSIRLRVNAGGNVSIGNTNNNHNLEVQDAIYAQGAVGSVAFYMNSSNAIRSNGTMYIDADTSGSGGFTRVGSGDIILRTAAATERMRIHGGGNVSIGNVNNTYKLDVSGTGRFTSSVTTTNVILSSDKRLKTKIKDIDSEKFVNAKWKTFELKEDLSQKRYGVIAQELEKTNPEFVRTDDEGMKSVAYIDLLIAKIAELEARLEKAGI